MSGRSVLFLLLVAMVMASSLGVVYTKYQARKLFVELQALQKIRDEMNVEWGQLQLEQSTWGTHARVEGIARNKLGMMLPPIDEVVIVKP